MKYFMDTEFNQEVDPVELISIGIKAEDDRELYAIAQFSREACDTWLHKNVLPILDRQWDIIHPTTICLGGNSTSGVRRRRTERRDLRAEATECGGVDWTPPSNTPPPPGVPHAEIADAITAFVGLDPKPEFWGYFADYDWFLFTRLWGRSGWMKMPRKFPRLCMDLKQYAIHLGVQKLPTPFKPEHHALVDARWTKHAFEFLMTHQHRKPCGCYGATGEHEAPCWMK